MSKCGILTVVLCALTVVSPPPVEAGAKGTDRPFVGRANGMLTGPIVEDGNVVGFVVDYTGHATHLGRFTRREFLYFGEDPGTFNGFMVFTAANGDELCLEFSGMFVSETEAVGTYEFTGGTGRFEEASGEAEFVATTTDPVGLTDISVEFRGRISY